MVAAFDLCTPLHCTEFVKRSAVCHSLAPEAQSCWGLALLYGNRFLPFNIRHTHLPLPARFVLDGISNLGCATVKPVL
jgi:hypothetical protein